MPLWIASFPSGTGSLISSSVASKSLCFARIARVEYLRARHLLSAVGEVFQVLKTDHVV